MNEHDTEKYLNLFIGVNRYQSVPSSWCCRYGSEVLRIHLSLLARYPNPLDHCVASLPSSTSSSYDRAREAHRAQYVGINSDAVRADKDSDRYQLDMIKEDTYT